jgi:hypothetical protein
MGPDKKAYTKNRTGDYLPPGGIPSSSSPDELAAIYPNSVNNICDCFMPLSYYEALDSYKIGLANDPALLEAFKQSVAQGAYSNPECIGMCSNTNSDVHTQSFYSASGGRNCKPVTICVSQQQVTNYGTMTGSNINFVAKQNCGNSAPAPGSAPDSTSAPGSGPDSTPDLDASEKRKKIIIIVLIILVILIIGGGLIMIF